MVDAVPADLPSGYSQLFSSTGEADFKQLVDDILSGNQSGIKADMTNLSKLLGITGS